MKCPGKDVALKPPSLSFADAASIPLAAMTALQALRCYNGDLTGKTVLVPAGCTLAKSSDLFNLLTMPQWVEQAYLLANWPSMHSKPAK